MKLSRAIYSLLAILTASLCCYSADRPPSLAGKSHRSVSVATNGMVATSHPLAAQIGLDILKNGGNAIDAAIATSAAMGLMEPTSCGIGGDLYAIVWDAKAKKMYGLNASGRAPLNATIEYFKKKNLSSIPTSGPLSWSVPGCVDGWDQLRARFGTRSFAELLEPSIRYAESGVVVPEVIAGYWRASQRSLTRDPGLNATFLIDDQGTRRAPRSGEVFKNPYLANSYRLIAKDGRDAFYRGEIAKKIVKLSEDVGGLFTMEDFTRHQSEWVDPCQTEYRGHKVWELPPPGQGIAALQMLNLLEGYDLKKLGPASPDYWHLLIEAKKLAFADRAKYYADPVFANVPINELISKSYADKRRKLISMEEARVDVPAGDGLLGKSETIYLSVVDKDRNCVSLIQSNYMGFGSGLSAPGTGFGIQNRGCLFSLDENHANKLEPGKRPFHTIIPAMVTENDEPCFVFGVMGGDMQPQGHVQVLVNLFDFGMDVQAAGDAPRIEHIGSATPTGKAAEGVGVVLAETSLPDSIVNDLTRRGHVVRRVRTNGGGYQGIWIDRTNGVLNGGTESRKDGIAIGY